MSLFSQNRSTGGLSSFSGWPANTKGFRFTSSVAGNVNGIRFWKLAGDSSTHTGLLWTVGSPGTELARVTFSGETASGWQYQAFASPYGISANTQYVASVSYSANLQPEPYQESFSLSSPSPIISPLSSASSWSHLVVTPLTYPNTIEDRWYGVDIVFDDLGNFVFLFPVVKSKTGLGCIVGALRGICLGGPTSYSSDTTFGRHLQVGVRKELVEGNPSAPCLALDYPGFWRFRWQLISGTQTLSCYAKQVSNVAGKRPTMVIKANASIGVAADVPGTAGAGTGWVKIGPLTVVATAPGAVWVELWNNDTDTFYSTAYFDNISV